MQRVDLKKRVLLRHSELPREWRAYPIFLAVSGGMDSSVLAAVALELRAQLPPLHFIHVNYHLRIPDSDREEASLRKWSGQAEIPIYVKRLFPRKKPPNLQAWAREHRLAFFHRTILQKCGGQGVVWLAHHQRDQAETVLGRLLRGSGLRGLGGMEQVESFARVPPTRRSKPLLLFRPFLEVTQESLSIYARFHRLKVHQDRSNRSDVYLRNRIRRRLLPLMRQENPQIETVLAELGARSRQASAALKQLSQDWLKKHAPNKKGASLELFRLRALPEALVSSILEEWLHARVETGESLGKILPPLLKAVRGNVKKLDLPLKKGLQLLTREGKLQLRPKSQKS